jgi:hypothetical protein
VVSFWSLYTYIVIQDMKDAGAGRCAETKKDGFCIHAEQAMETALKLEREITINTSPSYLPAVVSQPSHPHVELS